MDKNKEYYLLHQFYTNDANEAREFAHREELLSEAWEYDSFNDARNFALKMSNYYDLHYEVEHVTETKYLVIFSELDNEQE